LTWRNFYTYPHAATAAARLGKLITIVRAETVLIITTVVIIVTAAKALTITSTILITTIILIAITATAAAYHVACVERYLSHLPLYKRMYVR
jgi:hypothetical protein